MVARRTEPWQVDPTRTGRAASRTDRGGSRRPRRRVPPAAARWPARAAAPRGRTGGRENGPALASGRPRAPRGGAHRPEGATATPWCSWGRRATCPPRSCAAARPGGRSAAPSRRCRERTTGALRGRPPLVGADPGRCPAGDVVRSRRSRAVDHRSVHRPGIGRHRPWIPPTATARGPLPGHRRRSPAPPSTLPDVHRPALPAGPDPSWSQLGRRGRSPAATSGGRASAVPGRRPAAEREGGCRQRRNASSGSLCPGSVPLAVPRAQVAPPPHRTQPSPRPSPQPSPQTPMTAELRAPRSHVPGAGVRAGGWPTMPVIHRIRPVVMRWAVADRPAQPRVACAQAASLTWAFPAPPGGCGPAGRPGRWAGGSSGGQGDSIGANDHKSANS